LKNTKNRSLFNGQILYFSTVSEGKRRLVYWSRLGICI